MIYGLRPNGDVARVSAYQSGSSVKLSGPNGSHNVHPSNERTIEGWIREAALVWHLTNVYETHPTLADGEHEKQKYEALKALGAERKSQLKDAIIKSP